MSTKVSVWRVNFTYVKSQPPNDRFFSTSTLIVAESLEKAIELLKVHYKNPVVYNITHLGKVGLLDYPNHH